MKSFLDGEEEWMTRHYMGFDPDLHNAGLAILKIRESNKARKHITDMNITKLSVDRKLKGLDACEAMVQLIQETLAIYTWLPLDYAIIESQQSYFKDTDSRAKIVGQANDLIMLATISGAAAAMFKQKGADISIKLPAQWKGQRKKKNMHERAKKLLTNQQRLPSSKRLALEDMCGHEWDALCMALKGAEYNV